MAKATVYDEVGFGYPGEQLVWVPVDEAFAFTDGEEKMWSAQWVTWHYEGETEKHKSFAKSWWFGLGGKMARIGDGAYGTSTVISRENPDE